MIEEGQLTGPFLLEEAIRWGSLAAPLDAIINSAQWWLLSCDLGLLLLRLVLGMRPKGPDESSRPRARLSTPVNLAQYDEDEGEKRRNGGSRTTEIAGTNKQQPYTLSSDGGKNIKR